MPLAGTCHSTRALRRCSVVCLTKAPRARIGSVSPEGSDRCERCDSQRVVGAAPRWAAVTGWLVLLQGCHLPATLWQSPIVHRPRCHSPLSPTPAANTHSSHSPPLPALPLPFLVLSHTEPTCGLLCSPQPARRRKLSCARWGRRAPARRMPQRRLWPPPPPVCVRGGWPRPRPPPTTPLSLPAARCGMDRASPPRLAWTLPTCKRRRWPCLRTTTCWTRRP